MTTVVARVAQRRVCLGCEADPHAPAVSAIDDVDQCGSCGTELTHRASDLPRLHGLRLARYVANLPEITELALERSIPHMIVNADQDLPDVCRLAQRALDQLVTFAPTKSVDHPGSRP